jgi:hypothetical protein
MVGLAIDCFTLGYGSDRAWELVPISLNEHVWSLIPDRPGESLAEIRSRALKLLNQEAGRSDLAA